MLKDFCLGGFAPRVSNALIFRVDLWDHVVDSSIEEGSSEEAAAWAVKDAQIRN
ncbi:hypothetical protein ACLOJK_039317 [Asimina triloba]